jgi:hypothetical protein
MPAPSCAPFCFQSKGTSLLLGDLLYFTFRRCFCALWSAHKPPLSTCFALAVRVLVAMAQAAPNAAAAEGGDWKARLNLPPKDTRIRTEVGLASQSRSIAGRCLARPGRRRELLRHRGCFICRPCYKFLRARVRSEHLLLLTPLLSPSRCRT